MSAIEDFLRAIDARWPPVSTRIPLQIIGSTALMLRTSYERLTTDSDILETNAINADVKARLLQLAGPGTELDVQHRMHVQILSEAIPFVPHAPRWLPLSELRLEHFTIEVLDIADVVVSKLKTFRPRDKDDIDAMVQRGLLSHEDLLDRFRLMVDRFVADTRGEDHLRACVRNLNEVERDYFGVAESEIEFPAWFP